MKRILAVAFLAGLLTCAGCFTTAPPKLAEPEPTPIAEPKAPPPVTPDQVNATNGHEKARALTEELDFENNRLTTKSAH
jgi:hypothetical protein